MKEIKFGTNLYYSQNWELLKKKVVTASKETWDSIWLPDHLSGIPGSAIDDFFCLWPVFGAFTELAKGKTLGSAVTDPYRLHPASLAQMATTLNHMTEGNFILGIGAGEGMNLKAYNISYDHAVTKMSESIQLMKEFWDKGTGVTFNGKYYKTKNAVMLPKPISKIPVWIAGNGPKTLKLTAEIADGWMPLGAFPEIYEQNKGKILEIMNKEERNPNTFTFGYFTRIFINDDEEKLNSFYRGMKGGLAMQPRTLKRLGYWKDEYEQIFKEATGFASNEMSILVYDREDTAKFDYQKLAPLAADIPDELIRESGMIGTTEDIIKKVQKFVNAGAEHFIFELQHGVSSRNAPFTYFDVSKIISEEIIPIFKDSN
ncbi:MAG: LLM class flavin-dependent oxidoreductase [Promethearchaeota archaeon]